MVVIGNYGVFGSSNGNNNSCFVAGYGVSVVADGIGKYIGTSKVGIGRIGKCTVVIVHYRSVGRLCKGSNGKCIALGVGVVAKYVDGYGRI